MHVYWQSLTWQIQIYPWNTTEFSLDFLNVVSVYFDYAILKSITYAIETLFCVSFSLGSEKQVILLYPPRWLLFSEIF